MKYIVGNWKTNKNSKEVVDWFESFTKLYKGSKSGKLNNLEVVICPPFVYLSLAQKLIKRYNLPIKLGAQDISPFNNGPFTGEISAEQLSEFVEYIIIGHSERRINFHEDDKLLSQKTSMAAQCGIKPIFCIQDENTFIPSDIFIVAYEPVWAIGSGVTEKPERADKIAKSIKQKRGVKLVIYGGSISPQNVSGFLKASYLDGVLPGGVSLVPLKFWQIVVNASSI